MQKISSFGRFGIGKVDLSNETLSFTRRVSNGIIPLDSDHRF